MQTHEFQPYADIPDMCVAELPETGDTCNRLREDHVPQIKTTLRAATDPQFDADTIIVTLPNGDELRIYAYPSSVDGVTVVQIDTDEVDDEEGYKGGRLRVNINDGAIWDGDPNTDEAPGAYFV